MKKFATTHRAATKSTALKSKPKRTQKAPRAKHAPPAQKWMLTKFTHAHKYMAHAKHRQKPNNRTQFLPFDTNSTRKYDYYIFIPIKFSGPKFGAVLSQRIAYCSARGRAWGDPLENSSAKSLAKCKCAHTCGEKGSFFSSITRSI